jgi:hypothetical protein
MKTYSYHNAISRIIRAQITVFRFFLGEDCPVPIIPLRFSMLRELFTYGCVFYYHGDEIIWLWKHRVWSSITCGGNSTFKTLADLDEYYDVVADYYAALEHLGKALCRANDI